MTVLKVITKNYDRNGCNTYQTFNDIVLLKEIKRLDMNDPDGIDFKLILTAVGEGRITEQDMEIIRIKCSKFKMGLYKFRKLGFEENGVRRLFHSKREVDNYNDIKLSRLQKIVIKLQKYC